MDSRLGEYIVSGTIAEWAVQTPLDTIWTTGFNCYYFGRCGITSTSATIPTVFVTSYSSMVASTASSPAAGAGAHHIDVTTIAIAIPIVLFTFMGIIGVFLRRHWQRQQAQQTQQHIQQQAQQHAQQVQSQDQLRVVLDLLLQLIEAGQQQDPPPHIAALNQRMQGVENNVNNLTRMVQTLADVTSNVNLGGLEEAMGEVLTCPVCMEILHNPVSSITARAHQNGGCRKRALLSHQAP